MIGILVFGGVWLGIGLISAVADLVLFGGDKTIPSHAPAVTIRIIDLILGTMSGPLTLWYVLKTAGRAARRAIARWRAGVRGNR